MNYKVVITTNNGSEVVLEQDCDCAYVFCGLSDGCCVSRVSKDCGYETLLNTVLSAIKYFDTNDNPVESFGRLLYEKHKLEEKNDN